MRVVFAVLRLIVAGAIVAAVIGQLLTSLAFWRDVDGITNPTIQVVNFFSFFTIESNIFAIVILIIGAFLLLRKGRRQDPAWFAATRLSVTTYMVTTGIVYNLLLRGIPLPQGSTLGWSNEILHVVAPIWLLLDWLFAPGRRPLPWRSVWLVVAFPIVWAGYTLIRGPLTYDAVLGRNYWYPYPFLNPNVAPTGYWSVSFYILLIAVVIAVVAVGAVWVSRFARHRATPAAPA